MDVEITINDKKLITQDSLTILEAASQAGIKIPTLCYLKRLIPIGSCRICSVEVKGIERPVPSCVAKVKEGYEIYTDTEKVWRVRKEALSHLLLDHPLDCPVCDKSGLCLLQDLTFEFGLTKQENKKLYPDRTHIFESEYIEYMATRCVMCSRCIRVCSDMYGNPFYEIKGSGYDSYIGLRHEDKKQYGGSPAGSSFKEVKKETNILKCYYCGNCIEVCPVGALISKPSKFKERYWQESPFSSVCDKCSAACRTEYYRYANEESLVRTESLFGGYLCKSGFFYEGIGKNNGYYISASYIKKKSVSEETAPENAINEFALRIKKISEKGEMENTAVLVSSAVSENDGFAVSKFAKDILKPGYFDIAEPELYRSNFLKFRELFKGEDYFDIKAVRNSEAMLYIGDIENEIPYVSYNIMKTHREQGGKLLSVNIKKELNRPLSRFEDIASETIVSDISSAPGFLNGLKESIFGTGRGGGGEIAKNILEADSISIILGDYFMSSRALDEEFLILKEIAGFLRNEQKTLYIFPLIKPFNYRGLMNAGVNPAAGSGFNSICSGLSSGKIKNLIYIGDVSKTDSSKEFIKHASDMEFLAVFSSKSSIVSSMADVVIPVKDFLENNNSFYENFEGKTISLNNEFNLGGYRYGILPLLAEISGRLGYSFNYINNELSGFIDSLKNKDVIYYNKIKGRSRFYYNDRTKNFY